VSSQQAQFSGMLEAAFVPSFLPLKINMKSVTPNELKCRVEIVWSKALNH
jgi:hypothetical protein